MGGSKTLAIGIVLKSDVCWPYISHVVVTIWLKILTLVGHSVPAYQVVKVISSSGVLLIYYNVY